MIDGPSLISLCFLCFLVALCLTLCQDEQKLRRLEDKKENQQNKLDAERKRQETAAKRERKEKDKYESIEKEIANYKAQASDLQKNAAKALQKAAESDKVPRKNVISQLSTQYSFSRRESNFLSLLRNTKSLPNRCSQS